MQVPPKSYPGEFKCCQAKSIEFFKDFAECLTESTSLCIHRRAYDIAYYCCHPNWTAIVDEANN